MKKDDDFVGGLPDVIFAREEIRDSEEYFWDNSLRRDGDGLVLQQTLMGSAFYEDEGGMHRVPKGLAMLFRHGEQSRYGLDGESGRPYRHRWVQIREDAAMGRWADRLRGEFGPVLRMSGQGEAGQMLAHRVEEERGGMTRDRLYLAEWVCRLLVALYREQIGARRGNDPVAYGRHLLDTQFRSPRNLKEWCRELGISREHFSREFSARYGETPAAYLRKLRLHHADGILRTHPLSLADVAAASGFASDQTFHRAYRNHYGVPPGKGRGATRVVSDGL